MDFFVRLLFSGLQNRARNVDWFSEGVYYIYTGIERQSYGLHANTSITQAKGGELMVHPPTSSAWHLGAQTLEHGQQDSA